MTWTRINQQGAAEAGLTEKDVAVLDAMADGLTYEGIQRRTGLSAWAVRKHQKQAFQKLGATSQAAAMVACFDRRIFRPTPSWQVAA